MKKHLILAAALSLSTEALADDDSEYMEVTGPDLSGAPLPDGLGLLVGWSGASGTAAGTAGLKQAALKAATDKAAQQKSKAQEKKDDQQQQTNEFQEVTKGNPGALQTLIHEVGLTLRQLLDNGGTYRVKQKGPHGEELEIEDCRPSGPLNPNELTCTQQKFELFTDPSDGVERWAFTLAVVEGRYNPKHYYAEPSGYYAEEVDNQSIHLVFDTLEDLTWQLQQVAVAK